ncbi:hypothetical protein DSCOOX_05620 [Desulfosarcina ovata subsp. ovata]|uniref:Prepilin-type N-terminal cleavage/methylation domain-containing protein n=2 Tax=Desulfosarcina ovata TaxID=83564 RepID=A0A5K8A4B4_9BACT|nr:hypothetical protein DSCOOX_05620 [Desulfosarcina ovata subsp. ovata]
MKPDIQMITPPTGKPGAGFTLLEVITALVVVAILASIASMGVVAALNSYAVVRENTALAQKIQLAAARINRELLELRSVDKIGSAPTYLVYRDADDEPRMIAEIDETIRIYDNPAENIDEAYLENNGDILSDRVASLSFSYFKGDSGWTISDDRRELSAIQFSIDLYRKDVAGDTVGLNTLVHPRNNDNYGGISPTSLASGPPTSEQYSCFISTALPVSTRIAEGSKAHWIGLFTGIVFIIGTALVRRHLKASGGPFNRGSTLVGMIITLLLFTALGAAIIPMISSSELQRTVASQSEQAYYLAESGLRYAASQYLAADTENDRFTVLNTLHGTSYQLANDQGQFEVQFTPYYLLADADQTNISQLTTKFFGELADGYSIPENGTLSVDNNEISFTSESISGNQITFTLDSAFMGTVAKDTPVYPVAQASTTSSQTFSTGGDLTLEDGSGGMFPERNGAVVINDITYTYSTYDDATDTLTGLRRTDGTDFTNVTVNAGESLRLKKCIRVTATGSVGSGEMAASRQIVYHVQIPEAKGTQRVTVHDRFDSLAGWNASTLGTHDIAQSEENNVLKVTGLTDTGGSDESLITLNAGLVNFDADQFDVQVKVGFDPQVPDYFTAGINFRLTDDGNNTYGLSFQRTTPKNDPSDGIDAALKPFEEDDKVLSLVLWQSKSGSKQWLAYKKIADTVTLGSITPPIYWRPIVDEERESVEIVDLSPVPAIPCDYTARKLIWESTCQSLDILINNLVVAENMGNGELDITDAYSTGSEFSLRLRIGGTDIADPCTVSRIDVVADSFNLDNATLLVRFKSAQWLKFEYTPTVTDIVAPGDRIDQSSGESSASATVYGYPLMTGETTGTLLLENVVGTFEPGAFSVAGKTDLATVTRYDGKTAHFIKAYYGLPDDCGTADDTPTQLDADKLGNPLDPESLNWPPDEDTEIKVDDDHFTLIDWDAVNSDITTISLMALTGDAPSISASVLTDTWNVVIRSAETDLTGTDSTFGLHAFGDGALNVYFDDFGYQSFVNLPVTVSQPLQY